MEEFRINIENGILEEVAKEDIVPLPTPAFLPEPPAIDYKKNLMRLLILSGLGFITIVLLGVSFFLVGIKL